VGAVLSVIDVLFASISTAHKAAPTASKSAIIHLVRDAGNNREVLPVVVNEKNMESTGIISRRVATRPKAV
jgi:hypothetical protein